MIKHIICASIGIVTLSQCGSDTASAVTAWLDTYASGFAISSPTASSTVATSVAETATVDPNADFVTKKAALDAVAEATTSAGCLVTLPNLTGLGQRANCFGRGIESTPAGYDILGGDGGIWDSVETTGEACASAQMNKLTGAASGYVDASLSLQAAAVCLLSNAGIAIPAAGASSDFSVDMAAALPTVAAGPTVSAATVTAVSASTFEYSFIGTTDGIKEFKITIRHTKGNEANTDYTGVIYGNWNGVNKDTFSVVYSKADTVIKARLAAGTWPSTALDSAIFDANGLMNMDGAWSGNMNHAIYSIDASTGVGNVSYAWQAGTGDRATRVFNVYTTVTAGVKSGCGFFGYGPSLAADYAANTNGFQGMYCNWNGTGHLTSPKANIVQRQCFTQATDGLFKPEAAKDALTYWPENECNKSAVTSLSPAPDHNASLATSANNLYNFVNDTDLDYAGFTAPTAPTYVIE